jgi:hypothetical protein
MSYNVRCIKNLLFLFSLCWGNAWAKNVSWHIQPKVCVNESAGQPCTFSVTVDVKGLAKEEYCLFLQQQKLQCLHNTAFPTTFELRLEEQSQLFLRNTQQHVVLTETLKIKSLVGQKQRRRLRSPWSLF